MELHRTQFFLVDLWTFDVVDRLVFMVYGHKVHVGFPDFGEFEFFSVVIESMKASLTPIPH